MTDLVAGAAKRTALALAGALVVSSATLSIPAAAATRSLAVRMEAGGGVAGHLAVAGGGAAVAGDPAPPAMAAIAGAPGGAASLSLVSQTFSLAPSSEFVVSAELLVSPDGGVAQPGATGQPQPDSGGSPAYEAAVLAGPAIESRAELSDLVAGAKPRSTRLVTRVPVEESSASAVTRLDIRLDVGGGGERSISFPADGLYPVILELRSARGRSGESGPLASIQTYVLYLSAEPREPLRVATVLPAATRMPGRDVNGRPTEAFAEALADGAPLSSVTALAASAQLPLTLAPVPETLSDLATAAGSGLPYSERAGLALSKLRVAALSPANQVLPVPYAAPASDYYAEPAVARDLAAQDFLGSDARTATLGVTAATDTALVPPGPFASQALAHIGESGAGAVLLGEEALQPVSRAPHAFVQPYVLQSPGGAMRAISPDPDVAALLSDGRLPAADAANLALAYLATTFVEANGLPRAAVIAPPAIDDLDVSVAEAILAQLGAGRWAKGLTLSALVDEVPVATARRGAPLVRSVDELQAEPLPELGSIMSAHAHVAGLASMMPGPGGLPQLLEERILAAEGRSRSGGSLAVIAMLDSVEARVEAETANVGVPDGAGVTLATGDGVIPLRLDNDGSIELKVIVELRSDSLRFPDGATAGPISVAPPGQTANIRVVADTTGVFPVEITLLSPDRSLVIRRVSISVRSTGASWVALLTTAVAAGVLLLWWAREFSKGRRRKAPNDPSGPVEASIL